MENLNVKLLHFNWHQAGSTESREGAGENYGRFTVGVNNVKLIEENEPFNGNQVWNYVVYFEDGKKVRIFNPNYVEYYP